MDTSKIVLAGAIGLVIGLVLPPTLFRSQGHEQGMMSKVSIDRHFIEQMIPHHEGAIEMAKLALERSKRPEVLSLSNGIIGTQESEIVSMKQGYKNWFGTEVVSTDHGGMHMDGMSGDLDDLKAAKDFDQEFVRQMIPHHEMAIMMAQMLQGSTDRAEMKKLAGNIITWQTREIEMMRGWMKAWNK